MRWSRTWQRNNVPPCLGPTEATSTAGNPPAGHYSPDKSPNALLATPFPLFQSKIHRGTASNPISDVWNIKKHSGFIPLEFIKHSRHSDPFQTFVRNPLLYLRFSPLSRAKAGHHLSLITLCAPPSHRPAKPIPNGHQNPTSLLHLLAHPFRFRPQTSPLAT